MSDTPAKVIDLMAALKESLRIPPVAAPPVSEPCADCGHADSHIGGCPVCRAQGEKCRVFRAPVSEEPPPSEDTEAVRCSAQPLCVRRHGMAAVHTNGRCVGCNQDRSAEMHARAASPAETEPAATSARQRGVRCIHDVTLSTACRDCEAALLDGIGIAGRSERYQLLPDGHMAIGFASDGRWLRQKDPAEGLASTWEQRAGEYRARLAHVRAVLTLFDQPAALPETAPASDAAKRCFRCRGGLTESGYCLDGTCPAANYVQTFELCPPRAPEIPDTDAAPLTKDQIFAQLVRSTQRECGSWTLRSNEARRVFDLAFQADARSTYEDMLHVAMENAVTETGIRPSAREVGAILGLGLALRDMLAATKRGALRANVP